MRIAIFIDGGNLYRKLKDLKVIIKIYFPVEADASNSSLTKVSANSLSDL